MCSKCDLTQSVQSKLFSPFLTKLNDDVFECTDFHAAACDYSLKKNGIRVEILFQNCGGKNLDSEQQQYISPSRSQ